MTPSVSVRATAPLARRGASSRSVVLAPAAALAALLLATGCSDDTDTGAAEPGESGATETSSSPATPSSSPTEATTSAPPEEPEFSDTAAGRREFVTYVVDGWSHALRTNDPAVLLEASGDKPCRGCDSLRRELAQREEEGWYVDFPGAEVRAVRFQDGRPSERAVAVVDIPASRSYFEDGSFRNDNAAHPRTEFLVDLRVEGRGDRRRWVLTGFSIS